MSEIKRTADGKFAKKEEKHYKVYSDVLNQVFNSVEELEEAESKFRKEKEELANKQKQYDVRKEELSKRKEEFTKFVSEVNIEKDSRKSKYAQDLKVLKEQYEKNAQELFKEYNKDIIALDKKITTARENIISLQKSFDKDYSRRYDLRDLLEWFF